MSDLRYDFGYTESSTYARTARLIASSVHPGLVVDLGAGVGSLALPLERFGFGYVGLDGDPANVAAMAARDRTSAVVDLAPADPVDAVDAVLAALRDCGVGDDEPVAAVTMLDVIEHLPDPGGVLATVTRLVDALAARRPGEPPLFVVSIPNVAHLDLAAKLLLGRWDVTEVGLLDDTHITLFTEARLDAVMTAAGFAECGRSDVVMPVTEQRFPTDLPTLGDTTLARFLRDLNRHGSRAGDTYQFVRAYQRTAVGVEDAGDPPATGSPFLTVVVRTLGTRSTLTDTLTALAAQGDDDFEVRLMVHTDDDGAASDVEALVASFAPPFARRVHVHHGSGGGRSRPLNDALAAAAGRYVAVLDDDDLVTSDWVAVFKRAAEGAPGRVVRARCVVQWIEAQDGPLTDVAAVSGFEAAYPASFSLLDHVRANRSPSCSYAVPMGLVHALGLAYDEDLRTCEDWKFLMEAARHAGVASDPSVTSIYRRWRGVGGSASAEDEQTWIADHLRVVADLDTTPTLVPPGTLEVVHRLYEQVEQLERELGRRGADDPPHGS